MNELRSDQQKVITETATKIYHGAKSLLIQAPTGWGKTVAFSTTSMRYNIKSGKRILVLVHRVELLKQFIRTAKQWYNLDVFPITAETKYLESSQIYVGMCETVFRRLSVNPNFIPEMGMVIFDEAHIGNFTKLHTFFPSSIILGFSATPIASNRKNPLKDYYQDIVCGPQIQELIKIGALVQNHTYSIKGVRRDKLKIKSNGEFDEHAMGDEFGKLRHVQNTIDKYRELAEGTKTLVFNCNIVHNEVMHKAWLAAGYQSRYIDSDHTTPEERADAFEWLKNTDGAILNNVGIATMGFDEPSLFTGIINRATTSPTLAIQMAGRISRPYPSKEFFTIIDMGGNYRNDAHGDWNSDRDWRHVFFNPPKPKEKLGAQPVKDCPACEGLIPLQAMICPLCGYEFPRKPENYDERQVQLELVTKNLNVSEMMEKNKKFSKYYTFFNIVNNISTQVKYQTKGRPLTKQEYEKALNLAYEKSEEWHKLNGMAWDKFRKGYTKRAMNERLNYNQIQSIEPITSL